MEEINVLFVKQMASICFRTEALQSVRTSYLNEIFCIFICEIARSDQNLLMHAYKFL